MSISLSVERLVSWFEEHFADPAEHLPYISAEGGYQWICPAWSTEDGLRQQFDEAPDDVIAEAVACLEERGGPLWVRLADVSTDGAIGNQSQL
jgi:hypothetical protein